MSAEEYYRLRVCPIYRSYPVYVKGREPVGYIEALKQKAPEVIFDPSKFHSKESWIEAGKLVFESDTKFSPAPALTVDDITVPASTVSKDGMLPGFAYRYYIREKGVLEVGINSCSGCHTRVMPDGSFWEGARGTPGLPRAFLLTLNQANPEQLRRRLNNLWINFGAPWVLSREEVEAHYTSEEYALEVAVNCCGVLRRQGTSLAPSSYPVPHRRSGSQIS